jgi:hypothetical protein
MNKTGSFEEGEVPDWWLCNDESQPFCNSECLVPIVRLHPFHAEANEKLCMECRGIYEDPELFWPFLDSVCEIRPYRGWVDFVLRDVRQVAKHNEQEVWLCAKLLQEPLPRLSVQ